MGTTTLENILNATIKWVAGGTVARMVMGEPGTITIRFDNKKIYVGANSQNFPFKRSNNSQSNNPQSS